MCVRLCMCVDICFHTSLHMNTNTLSLSLPFSLPFSLPLSLPPSLSFSLSLFSLPPSFSPYTHTPVQIDGVPSNIATASYQTRIIVRDVTGKYTWDCAVLYGPEIPSHANGKLLVITHSKPPGVNEI